MPELTQCERCQWQHMQETAGVRPPPWTADDAGLMFQACARCGSVSIQKFSVGGAVDSVWILTDEAMVMFRDGVAPSQVFQYLFTDDFVRNRGVTLNLFRGYLASMHDLSGFTNLLVARAARFLEVEKVQLCLDMLRDTLAEYLRREAQTRLAVTTVTPVTDLLRSRRALNGPGGKSRVDLQFRALEILEMFAQPALWRSVPPAETSLLERAIDHIDMVDESIARTDAMSREVDDGVLLDAFAEARFMYRLFRRRQARLSRPHAAAIWRLMRVIEGHYTLGSPVDLATRTYDALRALLEHQLVESGFFKLGTDNRDGQTYLRFRSPHTQDVLHLPLYGSKLEIFADPDDVAPTAKLDSWTAAIDRL